MLSLSGGCERIRLLQKLVHVRAGGMTIYAYGKYVETRRGFVDNLCATFAFATFPKADYTLGIRLLTFDLPSNMSVSNGLHANGMVLNWHTTWGWS